MYQAEIDAARRLIADTDAAGKDANARARRAEEDLNRQKAQYNQIANAREIDRKEIDNIQRKIAENEAVSFKVLLILKANITDNSL